MCRTVNVDPHKCHLESAWYLQCFRLRGVDRVSEAAHRINDNWPAGSPSIILLQTQFSTPKLQHPWTYFAQSSFSWCAFNFDTLDFTGFHWLLSLQSSCRLNRLIVSLWIEHYCWLHLKSKAWQKLLYVAMFEVFWIRGSGNRAMEERYDSLAQVEQLSKLVYFTLMDVTQPQWLSVTVSTTSWYQVARDTMNR